MRLFVAEVLVRKVRHQRLAATDQATALRLARKALSPGDKLLGLTEFDHRTTAASGQTCSTTVP